MRTWPMRLNDKVFEVVRVANGARRTSWMKPLAMDACHKALIAADRSAHANR